MNTSDIFKQLCIGTSINFKEKTLTSEVHNGKSNDNFKTMLHPNMAGYAENIDASKTNTDPEGGVTLLSSFGTSYGDDVGKSKKRKKTRDKVKQDREEHVCHIRKKNKMRVYGTDIPEPMTEFNELRQRFHMQQSVLDNIQGSAVAFSHPTPIQMQAIPVMINRREVLACAPTGSGKTAAYIIPILQHLHKPKQQGFRAIVLAPTRELAKQIHREFCRLSHSTGFRIHVLNNVILAIKKYQSSLKYDILISTPKKLVMLLKHQPPVLDVSTVKWLVIDESDKLFESGKRGFRNQLAHIYRCCSEGNLDVRRAMFSATCSVEVEHWCRDNLDNLITVTVGIRNSAVDVVEQELVFVGSESGKLFTLRDLLKKGFAPPVLIFVQSKERGKQLYKELLYDGINVDVIHADRSQQERDEVVHRFRSGATWVLICTELMSRGIDFKGVNLVVNFDFPQSTISYIHRIGRTGRAGRGGRAVTFFTHDDIPNLRSIAAVMRRSGCSASHIPQYMLQINKHSKKEKRKLKQGPVKRDPITTNPISGNPKRNCVDGSTVNTPISKGHIRVKDGSQPRPKKLTQSAVRRKDKYKRFKEKIKKRKKDRVKQIN